MMFQTCTIAGSRTKSNTPWQEHLKIKAEQKSRQKPAFYFLFFYDFQPSLVNKLLDISNLDIQLGGYFSNGGLGMYFQIAFYFFKFQLVPLAAAQAQTVTGGILKCAQAFFTLFCFGHTSDPDNQILYTN